jgi:predicted  nucleic acid-binding Zn-ribbon protein
MRAEYYREWRAKKRAKAAETTTEADHMKADLKAALEANTAIQKTLASRDETIRHLEKMVERLSADLCARLERIETALQAMLAVPLAHAVAHPTPDPTPQPSQPAPPWMKR